MELNEDGTDKELENQEKNGDLKKEGMNGEAKRDNQNTDHPIASLSEEQQTVYHSALDGYVFSLLFIVSRICSSLEMQERERVMFCD